MEPHWLPKYKQYLEGEKAGDPKSVQMLGYLRQHAPTAIQQLDAALGQEGGLPESPATAQSQPTSTTTTTTPTTTTPPSTMAAPAPQPATFPPAPAPDSAVMSPPSPDANVMPAGFGQPSQPAAPVDDSNVMPQGFGAANPGGTSGMGPLVRRLGNRALEAVTGPPRPAETDFSKGFQSRMTAGYEGARGFLGLDQPEAQPATSPAAQQTEKQVMSMGGPQEQGYTGQSLARLPREAMAVGMEGTQVPKHALAAYIESIGGPHSAQYGDLASKGYDVAQVLLVANELGRMAYNQWPRGVAGLIRRRQAAQEAFDAAVTARQGGIEAGQRGYEAAQNARQADIRRLGMERQQAVRTARQQAVPAAGDAVEGAQRTLAQVDRELADQLSSLRLPGPLKRRSIALENSPDRPGAFGGPATLRTLRNRSDIPGSRQGSLRLGDVPPDLTEGRLAMQARGAARADAEKSIDAAIQATNPAQAQEHLRRAYQSIQSQFPDIGRDPTFQMLRDATEAIETAGAPIERPPVVPRPTRPPPVQRPDILRGRPPTRPTYGQARNRLIRRTARGALIGGAGGLGATALIGWMFKDQFKRMLNEESMTAQGLEPQTPPHMQLQP